jgi:hypothetical protein
MEHVPVDYTLAKGAPDDLPLPPKPGAYSSNLEEWWTSLDHSIVGCDRAHLAARVLGTGGALARMTARW